MKQLLILSVTLIFSSVLNAQNKSIAESDKAKDPARNKIVALLAKGSGGGKCDDKNFETCPSGYMYCLPEIPVGLLSAKFNLNYFTKLVDSENDTQMKKYLLKSSFLAIFSKVWKSELAKGVLNALVSGNVVLRKAIIKDKTTHYFILYKAKWNSTDKNDYIGHLSLVRGTIIKE